MPDPTTAGEWLAEAIGEREADMRPLAGRMSTLGADRTVAAELAYLAALKAIAHLHRPDGHGDCWTCAGSIYSQYEYPRPTLRTVASVFEGREGYDRWFR